MKRIILNVLLMILAFTIQNCIFPLIPFLSASPNLLLILTFSFGFIYGKELGMYYGLFAGILLDLFYSGPFGFYTLLFVNIGYFNGICTKYYYEDYITLPLILSLVNELAYNCYIYVLRFLIRNRLDFFYYAKEIIIPETIFTVVTTLLLYRFFLFTNRRLEEMENRRV
ncbi:MAG: rod shape-determining protein MreD [Lachnospiraceae bacterium]|nr:rod shape-determining protein MreD [Lachnospiraceae bacterium]